jgi:2TM domain-containing protein
MSREGRVLRPSCFVSPTGKISQTARLPLDVPGRSTLSHIQRAVNKTRRGDRRDFASLLASASLVIALMVVIWAATGAGSFWPIWVIFGLGIALALSAWRAFGPRSTLPNDTGAGRQPDGP